MRDMHDANTSQFVLVKNDIKSGIITETWNAMGLKGTQSHRIDIDMLVDDKNVLKVDYDLVAKNYMIPFGHITWASAWFGAAEKCYKRVQRYLRKNPKKLNSYVKYQLAEIRKYLEIISSVLDRCTVKYDTALNENDRSYLNSYQFSLQINNLKIIASEYSYKIADKLMDIVGLFDGYIDGSQLQVERVYRDLRSASLMFHNRRIYEINGSLLLMERN